MTFSDPIVDDVVLVRPAIQSPDYDPGAAGWSINADGSAEFGAAVVRGSVDGTGALESTNYVPGVSGWAVKADGSAEFADVTARGRLIAGPAGQRGSIDTGPGSVVVPGAGVDGAQAFRYGPGSRQVVHSVTGDVEGTSGEYTQTVYGPGPGPVVLAKPYRLFISTVGAGSVELHLGQGLEDVRLYGSSLPRGKAVPTEVSRSSATGISTVAVAVLTSDPVIFQPGRAYAVEVGGAVFATVADTLAIRSILVGGTVAHDLVAVRCAAGGSSIDGTTTRYLSRTAATASAPMAVSLTMRSSSGTTPVNYFGSVTAPRWLSVTDCGSADDFPEAVPV